MQVQRKETLGDYMAFLRQNAEEVHALFADFLISVTTFFRDPSAWDALAKGVIPLLFEDGASNARIRAWIPGCATGEEAYSVAMLVLEEAHRRDVWPEVQIFASDLDEGALATAREGRYPQTIAADVSDERLQHFFRQEGTQYAVSKELRDCVLFTTHSLLRDPPFSRLDLISCRNLLIYLDHEIQQQAYGIFRYALRPDRYLFLGASETAEGKYFCLIDKTHHLYQARQLTGEETPHLPELLSAGPLAQIGAATRLPSAHAPDVSTGTVHRLMLEALAPPSMVVNEQRQAVHLSESAGRFLQPSGGPLTRDATQLVRLELRADLCGALFRAFDRGESSLSGFIPVRFDGDPQRVALLVRPQVRDGKERLALVIFIEGGPDAGRVATSADHTDAEVVQHLERQLRETEDRLATTRQEFEAGNEELRAANEELQSINEEYRSTAEELETSKEELQSINEELETVNAELKTKLEEILHAHGDLENLMAATEIGTLFLDRELRIARFTPPIAKLINITDTDRGRPITDFTHGLDYVGLATDARHVLKTLAPLEREVRDEQNRWYLMRIRPYRTLDDRIDGVIVTFVDFTARREAEEALRRSEERYRLLVEGVDEYAMVMLDLDGRITTWNAGANKLFGYAEAEVIDLPFAMLFAPDDVAAGIPERALAAARAAGTAVGDRWHVRKNGSRFWASGVLTALRDPSGAIRGFANVLRDNTERKAAEVARVHFQSLFESAPGSYLVLRPEDYEIVAASDAYLAATMVRREEIIGRRLFEAFPDDPLDPTADGAGKLRASLERVKQTRRADVMAVQRYPIRRPAAVGGQFEERWWSPVNSPVTGPGGELAYIIHRVEDVTPFLREMRDRNREAEAHQLLESRAQHMQAEVALRGQELLRANEQLHELNDALEARGRERERLLDDAKDARIEAEQQRSEALVASQAKTQFITTMSHELRTPLNAIAGYVQLLELEVHGPLTDAQRTALARIQRAERHLLGLVNDVLNVNRLESGRLVYDMCPTDLGAVMKDVTSLIEPQLATKGLVYDVRHPPEGTKVWADADKLRQVLLNLLANAVRFTPNGGRISVDVSSRSATPSLIYLQVKDTGVGVARHKQDVIFEPFVQLNRTFAQATDGTGLGLTISRELARGMGGDLRVRSAEGEGARFTVTLRLVTGDGAPLDQTTDAQGTTGDRDRDAADRE